MGGLGEAGPPTLLFTKLLASGTQMLPLFILLIQSMLGVRS